MIQSYNSFDELLIDIKNLMNIYGISQDKYIELRNSYNSDKTPLKLLVLIFCSFNNIIRFNHSNEFNASYGEFSFNSKKEEELKVMYDIIKKRNFIFTDLDFQKFDFSKFDDNDFIYCDPPYLISTAFYNEKRNEFSGWDENNEKKLYDLLDQLNERKIKFGLSNVLVHKNQKNEILEEWSKKYLIYFPDIQYNHSSYNLKERNIDSIEVYVTNHDSGYRDLIQENLF